MIDSSFEQISSLQYIIRNKERIIRELKSGEYYIRQEEKHKRDMVYMQRLLNQSRRETKEARDETRSVKKVWESIFEDLQKEYDILAKQNFELMQEVGALKEALAKERQEKYDIGGQLEEEKEKNLALNARINKDYTNSSKSSSATPNHTTIHNSREKSGRKPGGQPGHKHHPRKFHQADRVCRLETPKEYLDTGRYEPTGEIVSKQLVEAHLVLNTTEYRAEVFLDKKTGRKVHAPFPAGVTDDVNYGGTVKALAYLLNNECNVSIGKTQKFLKEASIGKLDIATGTICNLSRQFSVKTEDERNKIFLELSASPVLHSDFTFGRVRGKQGAVIICATPDGKVLYQARTKKGNEGVKGSPLEFYGGTLVSDHEAAIIKHGSRHQECLAHVERYVRGSMENEPGLKWNKEMLEWIKDNIAYWNRLNSGDIQYDINEVRRRISIYDSIMEKAKKEYEYEPPGDYYKDGYNLYLRMAEDREDYVLFLRDPSVPPTNNLAERLGRKVKRKMAEVMSFRGNGNEFYCDGLSIMESLKGAGENLFEGVARRFDLPVTRKRKKKSPASNEQAETRPDTEDRPE